MLGILSFIDIFPGSFINRINYNGRWSTKSRLGGCGTIFYLLLLSWLIVHYSIPVYNFSNPKTTEVTYPEGGPTELLFKDIGTPYFQIKYGRRHYELNRTILDIYAEQTTYSFDADGNENEPIKTRYEVAPCKGISNHWLPWLTIFFW